MTFLKYDDLAVGSWFLWNGTVWYKAQDYRVDPQTGRVFEPLTSHLIFPLAVKVTVRAVQFESVNTGDTFVWEDSAYIKLTDDRGLKLATSEIVPFTSNVVVVPIDLELKYENRG